MRARDTLTATDREAELEMPLVWPVLDDEPIAPEPLIPSVVRTVGIVPAVFIPAPPRAANPDPPPASWLHSHRAKSSILSVFLAFITASVVGIVIAEHQKRHPNERRTATAFG